MNRRCLFAAAGCTFEGTAEQVDDHMTYMFGVDDPEHEMAAMPEVDVPPAQPEAGAPVTGRPEFCRGTHNGKHRDACTACGAKPDGSDW